MQWPDARKVPVANYDHDLKGIMQELCDHLTNQNVLKIPQEHNMFVHSVCPSFLQRKRRARYTPKHLLTKNDCRLLINFGPINDLVCNIPSLMVTPMDVFDKLGRWKHIIVMNLYNAFYQNHMHQDDQPYLGIMTPFGGLRLLARSGQGLIGQREEMDELMAKVLHEEMKEGCITKIQDDVIIGGQTQIEAAHNYVRVLRKLSLTNLKAEPEKINIFPVSADIAGWYWKRGGYLSVSPHRQNALMNIRQDSIQKIHHLRSFIGLYKTIQMAAPAVSRILAPLEEAAAGKESGDPVVWDNSLVQKFKEAKRHIQNVHTLYLPHPEDQLVVKTDAALNGPGVGHTVYTVKDKELVPVRFHSTKLKPQF